MLDRKLGRFEAALVSRLWFGIPQGRCHDGGFSTSSPGRAVPVTFFETPIARNN